MASKVIKDLVGSTLTQVEAEFGAEAERRVFVRVDRSETTSAQTLLGHAIEKAVEGANPHPEDETLPLQRAKARQIGQDTVEVILEYKRLASSGGGFDTPSGSFAVLRSSAKSYMAKIYKDPANNHWLDQSATDPSDPTLANQQKAPQPSLISRSELLISVPVVVSGSLAALNSAMSDTGSINSNVLNFAGKSFGVGSMLLEGVDVEWRVDYFGTVYSYYFAVEYKFRYRPYGFQEEYVTWDSSNNKWDVAYYTPYTAVNMSGYPS